MTDDCQRRWMPDEDNEITPPTFVPHALSFGIRRHASEGLAILRQVEAKITQRSVGDPEATYKIAQAYAMLGDKASALRVLKHSIESGFFSYLYFLTDPLLNNFRDEPEFTRIMTTARQRHQALANGFLSIRP
jgi:hypothetical protein